MGKTYRKDIMRFILKGKKRFLSLMTITILGVTMLTGLKATCDDLRRTTDEIYDTCRLFDISIQSTLGLTEEDAAALSQIETISAVSGSYTETVETLIDQSASNVQIKTLTASGINTPYIVDGRLPEKANEIAVAQNYISDSGKSIGDTVTLQPEEDTALTATSFTIVGVVIDPADLLKPDGPASFRSTSSTDYTFF